jgi:hypothetical protein
MHMTLQKQVEVYWQVLRCWNNAALAKRQGMTFGKVVKLLRGIIDAPENPRICLLATALLNDVVKNTESPAIPEVDALAK